MNNTFYGPDENYYLEHHGILGMKWGKQNGPPYPLSDAKHDRIVKRAEKRRQRIAKDPKKLYKHSDEFTVEEINEALTKIDARNRIKSKIPTKQKKVKLSPLKKRWAKNALSLERHASKYTPEELKVALDRLNLRHQLYDKKMSEIDRPRKAIDIGTNYMRSFYNLLSGTKDYSKLFSNNTIKLDDKQRQKIMLKYGKDVKTANKKDLELYELLFGKGSNVSEDTIRKVLKDEGLI